MKTSQRFWRGLFFLWLITVVCSGLMQPAVNSPARAAPQMQSGTNVVISQVYGGGGNSGATFKNDFIELFNRGTTTVDLTGWSVQYASAGSTTWTDRTDLHGSIGPGQYYLIQEAAGNGGTTDLPTPDETGDVAMSATAGKVALVNTTTALSGNGCPLGASIIDFIGYGSGTNCSEGTAATAPSATTADLRNDNGCSDTNNNSADFVTGPPTPRNSASTATNCGDVFTATASAVNLTSTASALTSTAAADLTGTSAANTSTAAANSTSTSVAATSTASAVNATATIVALTGTNTPTSTATATATNTPTNTVPAPVPSVVISEFRTSGPRGANDEFIELYNPTTAVIDISGWKVSASNNSGNTSVRATIPPSTILRSGQYYLVANTSGTDSYSNPNLPPNLVYGVAISDNGGIALLRANDTIVDQVGMSSGSFYKEGTTLAPLTGTDESYERKSNNCQDTNNNNEDFAKLTSSPHNYASPLNLCGESRPTPAATTTTITADNPDPSVVNGIVTVSVTVTGGTSIPAGIVNVTSTGATSNCIINLSTVGTGSCNLIFTSTGTKSIVATYVGDNFHWGSSNTASHQVTTASAATAARTPTRVPTLIPPPPLLVINEFVPRPGHDWNLDGVINVNDEYIEILNHGVVDVNLSGYSLDDEVNIGSTPFRLPSVVLKPGERRVFYGSETGLLLSDGGDGVRLLKPNGQLGDAYNYFVVRFPDQSYCRLPDNGGADDWNQNCFPTPGLQNSLSRSTVNPPTAGDAENLCPIADTLPADFVFAECLPFGNNIWNPAYWDRFGWYNEKNLPDSPGKWPIFAD